MNLPRAHTETDLLLTALTDQTPSPPRGRNQREHAQSLARGAIGVALLHVERAHLGAGTWQVAHSWVQAATRGAISAADDAGLYIGAPAVAFVLHAAGADGNPRYESALTTLDSYVNRLAHRRVDAALTRIAAGRPASFVEYDLFYGLTGIGHHLLQHAPGSDVLGRILNYLIRLTAPLGIDHTLPGWWVSQDPDPLLPTPGGHSNLGLAHGITGPLALLAHALRRGVAVEGQTEAISAICAHLDTWQHNDESGTWWPQWITRRCLRTGRTGQQHPPRPSWCYGTPGIARALQTAAIAIGDTARQAHAEKALAASLTDQTQLAQVTDTGLCHGWAGLYQTAWRAARDAIDPAIAAQLPHIVDCLTRAAGTTDLSEPGLLNGGAGLALSLHTSIEVTPPASGWDSCLLIA